MAKTPSYDELMARQDVDFISECDGYLYVSLPARQMFDNTIWKVNKRTKEVSYMMFTEYIITVSKRAKYIKAPDWETQTQDERRGA